MHVWVFRDSQCDLAPGSTRGKVGTLICRSEKDPRTSWGMPSACRASSEGRRWAAYRRSVGSSPPARGELVPWCLPYSMPVLVRCTLPSQAPLRDEGCEDLEFAIFPSRLLIQTSCLPPCPPPGYLLDSYPLLNTASIYLLLLPHLPQTPYLPPFPLHKY